MKLWWLLLVDAVWCSDAWPKCRPVLDSRHFRRSDLRCQLHRYRPQDVASCLDTLRPIGGDKLHFQFVGDSRIRQHFFSFIQSLPDYDLSWRGDMSHRGEFKYSRIFRSHNDMHVFSRLLNVLVSFRWRPVIDQQLLSELRHSIRSTSKRPHFMLIGIAGHHMLRENGADVIGYQIQLKKLTSLLKVITKNSGAVWLHQYPILDMFGVTGTHNTDIHQQKIHLYNQIANSILRRSGVEIWNSSDALVEEYVRSCGLNARTDSKEYRNCINYIHAGFSIIDHTTQLLLNYMCNNISAPHPAVPQTPQTCCF